MKKSIVNGNPRDGFDAEQFASAAVSWRGALHVARMFAALSVIAVVQTAVGDDVLVPSSYDEVSGQWIGNVDALTNALANLTKGQTVMLSKGIYDVSPVTNAPLWTTSDNVGDALLDVKAEGAKVVGETGKPEDVVIKAVNSEYRIFILNGKNSSLHGVTVCGGNALSAHISGYNFRSGGGVVFNGSGTVVSNCVFTGNKASIRGGAVSGPNGLQGTVYDSVFYGNNCPVEGMAANQVTIYNCTFTNNVSEGEAKDGYGASVTCSCRIYNSRFENNRSNGGGAKGGVAVNCRFLFNRQENLKGDSYSNSGGGAARDAVLSNCYFYGNSAYRLGGAIRGGRVVNCEIVSNITRRALSDIYANGGGIYGATLVENCTVVSNYAGYGGGVCDCGPVFDTLLAYNCAQSGGGAAGTPITRCIVEHNVATKYGYGETGGSGGGLYLGSATNCVFRDNSSSATGGSTCLKGCDIADSRVDAKIIDGCVLHDIANTRGTPVAVGNVAYPNGRVITNGYMISGMSIVRNTLFTNCIWQGTATSPNLAAFYSTTATGAATVQNCTFVDNLYRYLFKAPQSANTFNMAFVNCVFSNNRMYASTLSDISGYDAKYLTLTNCLYGVAYGRTVQAEGVVDVGSEELGAGWNPRFLGSGDHPYTPRLNSPLRGKGVVQDWMLDATDLAGNPRLRDGAVDVGCYECWLLPKGTALSIR